MSDIMFEYYYEYTHHHDVKILRVVATQSSIAIEKLKAEYPNGHFKLLEIKRLDY